MKAIVNDMLNHHEELRTDHEIKCVVCCNYRFVNLIPTSTKLDLNTVVFGGIIDSINYPYM
ncbi:MAG: hypothetical protein P0116_00725 [Candidatus Nitrosocosmicus sp.]|nr:hypothetical protein [Candidatus Nitrosocosmicus sp.]